MQLSEETIDELTNLLQQLTEIQIDNNEIDHVVITGENTLTLKWKVFCIFANHSGYKYDFNDKEWYVEPESNTCMYIYGRSIGIPPIEEQEIFLNLYNFMTTRLIGSIRRKNKEWTIKGNSIYDTKIHLHIVQDILVKFAGKN